MILFRPEHAELILSGRKTQTRRIWKKPRARVGSIHLAKTKMLSKDYFARLKICGLAAERLGDISEDDAQAEGYPSVFVYLKEFQKINKIPDKDFVGMLNTIVYVVYFEVIS